MEYKCLKKQIFSSTSFSIVPIRMEDRFAIMQWRNEQIYHLRQSRPLTVQDQETYFNEVVCKLFDQEKPSQILFSYLEEGVCIGYGGLVHINWLDRNAEISFCIDTEREKNEFHKHWSIYLGLIEEVADKQLNLHKIYTYAFDLRPHLYVVLFDCDYVQEAVLREHCHFQGEFIDVVIHSKIFESTGLVLRRANLNDSGILFTWVNDAKVRMNSFNSEPISWEDHDKWFREKLRSTDSKIYIFQDKHIPIGQVRIDKKGSEWTIDYSIDSNFRGKGYGETIIRMLMKQIPSITLVALVKTTNKTSRNIFEKLGFEKGQDMQVNGTLTHLYKLEGK